MIKEGFDTRPEATVVRYEAFGTADDLRIGMKLGWNPAGVKARAVGSTPAEARRRLLLETERAFSAHYGAPWIAFPAAAMLTSEDAPLDGAIVLIPSAGLATLRASGMLAEVPAAESPSPAEPPSPAESPGPAEPPAVSMPEAAVAMDERVPNMDEILAAIRKIMQ